MIGIGECLIQYLFDAETIEWEVDFGKEVKLNVWVLKGNQGGFKVKLSAYAVNFKPENSTEVVGRTLMGAKVVDIEVIKKSKRRPRGLEGRVLTVEDPLLMGLLLQNRTELWDIIGLNNYQIPFDRVFFLVARGISDMFALNLVNISCELIKQEMIEEYFKEKIANFLNSLRDLGKIIKDDSLEEVLNCVQQSKSVNDFMLNFWRKLYFKDLAYYEGIHSRLIEVRRKFNFVKDSQLKALKEDRITGGVRKFLKQAEKADKEMLTGIISPENLASVYNRLSSGEGVIENDIQVLVALNEFLAKNVEDSYQIFTEEE